MKKLEEEMKANGITPVFYYHRTSIVNNVFTACLLIKDGEVLSRGVSICSVYDLHNKKVARLKSLNRANKALLGEADLYPIQISSRDWTQKIVVRKPFNKEFKEIDVTNNLLCSYKTKSKEVIINALYPLYETAKFFMFKASYKPRLTEYENHLVVAINKKNEKKGS